jgi:NMT1/THI5 like.
VTRIGSGTYDFGFGDINVLLDFNAKNAANAGRAVYMLYYRSPLSIGSFAKAGISKPSDLVDRKIGGSLGDGAYKLFPAYAASPDQGRLDQMVLRRPSPARVHAAQG